MRCVRTSEDLAAVLDHSVPADGHAWLIADPLRGELANTKRRLRTKVSFATRFSAPPHELDELTRMP
jgi:hypothetical protein